MNKEYDPHQIEAKWQGYWHKNKTFRQPPEAKGKKFYCLDMFPYPSGSGLHIGHPLGYTATDIFSRYKRMCGYSVLHPMGYDAFGLPAEQHAVATGEHPAEITSDNCNRFTEQMKKIGFSYDWDREIKTCTPDYYKWTQWIFLKLYNSWFDKEKQKARPIEELPIPDPVFKEGRAAILKYQEDFRFAYIAEAMVNWCPALGTVLANEEVIEGKSERGGHDVFRKPMRQWMLRITAYADRLLSELEDLDWPESIKDQQRNWIGKRHGAEIVFKVSGSDYSFTAFTTRPDTLFGVTFFVISPEHPLVSEITTKEQKVAVDEYCHKALLLSEFDRTLDNRKKTGVFSGSYVINPINQEQVPLYVGDYVLMSYGTGAVMGVPAHDERDFEFANLFNLQITPVIEPQDQSNPEAESFLQGKSAWTKPGKMMAVNRSEVAKNLELSGLDNQEGGKKIVTWLQENSLGRGVINYRLRDWLFSRQRYWGEPIPIVHWEDGTTTALTEEELPLILPRVNDYKPSEGGESPLAKAGDWLEVTCPKTGLKGRRETNTMPQWAGSCWYYLRFIDPHNDNEPWDKDLEKSWMNVDLYVGGAEHAVLHLLYSRFWHKVLFDLGHVSTKEPFQKLFNQGMILAHAFKDNRGALVPVDEVNVDEDGVSTHKLSGDKLEKIVAKMSKSLRNVINPEEVMDKYGADTLRMYLMFMGPLDASRIWDSQAISGNYRFLKRVYSYFSDTTNFSQELNQQSEKVLKALHLAIKRVTEGIDGLKLNTAIAALMECLNAFSGEKISKDTARSFIILLSPFAPHLAEEVWASFGETESIAYQKWPSYDEDLLKSEVVNVVIQINGKKRGLIEVDTSIVDEMLKNEAISAMQNTPYKIADSDKFIFVRDKGTSAPKLVNVISVS